MNASLLQCLVRRIGLSSAFHFHATFFYNKSTVLWSCKYNVIKEGHVSRSWEGFSIQNRKHGKTHEPFGGGIGNKERSRSVTSAFYWSESSILHFWRIPASAFPYLSFSFWYLTYSSPLSVCQISFSPVKPNSRKFQDHLQEFTVSTSSYLELSYRKY